MWGGERQVSILLLSSENRLKKQVAELETKAKESGEELETAMREAARSKERHNKESEELMARLAAEEKARKSLEEKLAATEAECAKLREEAKGANNVSGELRRSHEQVVGRLEREKKAGDAKLAETVAEYPSWRRKRMVGWNNTGRNESCCRRICWI